MRRTDIGVDRQMMKFFSDIQSWLYGGASAELKGLAAGFDMMKLLAAMAIAAVFGMLHALMPGHGKTVIVSYYLGRPAQLLSSVVTSGILVLTHVGSAVVLVLAAPSEAQDGRRRSKLPARCSSSQSDCGSCSGRYARMRTYMPRQTEKSWLS